MEVDPPIGTQVEIVEKGLHGTVAFVGPTEFQAGKWIGVVLDEPKGKNNGNVQGKEYFRCEENCGIFVRPTQVKWTDPLSASTESLTDPSKPKSSGLRAPSVKRPSGIGGEAGGSSTNLTEQDVAAAKEPSVPDSASKIKPPSKMQTPAPMKTSASSEKLKPSPSVEKQTPFIVVAFAQQIAHQKKLEHWMVELNVRMKQLSVNANVTPFAKFASQQIPPSATCVGRISFATDDVNLAGRTVKVVADDKQLLKLRESLLSI